MRIGCINMLIIDTPLRYLTNYRRAMKNLLSLLNRYVMFTGKFIDNLLFPYDFVNNHLILPPISATNLTYHHAT